MDGDSYDDFYAKIYDKLHLPEDRAKTELSQILKITGADDNSVFLDVGSGTGETLRELAESGAKCVGVEKSPYMVAMSKAKTDAPVKQTDVLEPMAFERAQFTHILCLYHTIYEIENKGLFFSNCRYWLRGGGYLVLHLVNKDRFNTIVPVGTPMLLDNPQNMRTNVLFVRKLSLTISIIVRNMIYVISARHLSKHLRMGRHIKYVKMNAIFIWRARKIF